MNPLQRALLINAVFSGVSGVVLITLNREMAEIFGLSNTSVFRVTGLALLGFAAMVGYEVRRQKPAGVKAIIIQDLLWVLGSLLLLIAQPFGISRIGNMAIAIVAIIVLGMGVNQARALKRRKGI